MCRDFLIRWTPARQALAVGFRGFVALKRSPVGVSVGRMRIGAALGSGRVWF